MLRIICALIASVLFLNNTYATPEDSLGIEKRNGKILVQHKVEKGETIYSILKRYDCTESDFLSVNPTFKKGDILSLDQVVEVPYNTKKKVSQTKAPVVEIIPSGEKTSSKKVEEKRIIDENGIEIVDIPEATPKDAESSLKVSSVEPSKEIGTNKAKNTSSKASLKAKTHTIIAGQNLFTVAKLYNIKVWQIREWNALTNDAVKIGQVLVVEKPASFVAKATPKKDTLKPKTTTQIQAPAGDVVKETPKESKEQAVINKPVTIPNKPTSTVPNAPGGRKVSENGIAEVITAGESTNKFLALHPTAPIGTLIKVSNVANGQSVWVKVIGKFNPTRDVKIRISKKAFDKLSPKDSRISAELSYSISN